MAHITELEPAIATNSSQGDRTPYLLDPALLKFLHLGVHCQVQLATKELELDAYDVPVPKDWKVVDLVVLDHNRQTIEQIVTSTPEYVDYKVIDHWQVIDMEVFAVELFLRKTSEQSPF